MKKCAILEDFMNFDAKYSFVFQREICICLKHRNILNRLKIRVFESYCPHERFHALYNPLPDVNFEGVTDRNDCVSPVSTKTDGRNNRLQKINSNET